MKKEWAAAQCGHAEIARAVALGEFLQPDGPEPRRAKRIIKVQSCGREPGAAEQINGISYYILGYPAIIGYNIVSMVTNLLFVKAFSFELVQKKTRLMLELY